MDLSIFYYLPVLVLALCFHEMSHAWMANRLGDPTARRMGRLTMNPAAHVDPIGTLLFPLLLGLMGLPVFGWAKPVPYNPRNLSRPGRDDALIAAAGPLSNVLLAVVGAVAFRVLFAADFPSLLTNLLAYFVAVNMILAFFNMIPVPPLDGGNVLINTLPPTMSHVKDFLRQYGFFLFVVLVYTGTSAVFLEPALDIASFLLGHR